MSPVGLKGSFPGEGLLFFLGGKEKGRKIVLIGIILMV